MPDHVLERGDIVTKQQKVGQVDAVQLGQRVSVQPLCNQIDTEGPRNLAQFS